MAQTSITIRIDETLKENMEQVCNELGMNLTTAITIFAKKMTREKRIPFDIAIDPFYSAENQSRLSAAKERMEKMGSTVHELVEVDND